MKPFERESLRAFRAVAREVRGSTVIASGQVYRISLRSDSLLGEMYDPNLPDDAFHSLAIAVRKVLLQKDRTQFGRVAGILKRYNADLWADVDKVRI